MASDSDIFEKMDALLRKHHPGAFAPADAAGDEPPVVAGEGEMAADGTDIPTLTEIVETLPTDIPPAEDSFPVLTEVVDVSGPSSSSELDYFDEGAYFPPEAVAEDEGVSGEVPDRIPGPAMEGALPAEPADFGAGGYFPADEVAADEIALPEAPYQAPEPTTDAPPEGEGEQGLDSVEPVAPAAPAEAVASEDHAPFAAAEPFVARALSDGDFGRVSDSLTEQVLRNLDRRLEQMLEHSLAPRLADSLDRALSGMLDQFAINIQQMIRESVAEELQKRLDARDMPFDADGAPSPVEHSKPGGDPV